MNRLQISGFQLDEDEVEALLFAAAWNCDGDEATVRLLAQTSDDVFREMMFMSAKAWGEADGLPIRRPVGPASLSDPAAKRRRDMIVELQRVAAAKTTVHLLIVHSSQRFDAIKGLVHRWWIYDCGLIPWLGEFFQALRRWCDEELDRTVRAIIALVERFSELGSAVERAIRCMITMIFALRLRDPAEVPQVRRSERVLSIRRVLAPGGCSSFFVPLA